MPRTDRLSPRGPGAPHSPNTKDFAPVSTSSGSCRVAPHPQPFPRKQGGGRSQFDAIRWGWMLGLATLAGFRAVDGLRRIPRETPPRTNYVRRGENSIALRQVWGVQVKPRTVTRQRRRVGAYRFPSGGFTRSWRGGCPRVRAGAVRLGLRMANDCAPTSWMRNRLRCTPSPTLFVGEGGRVSARPGEAPLRQPGTRSRPTRLLTIDLSIRIT
jgi:hypothetical protein